MPRTTTLLALLLLSACQADQGAELRYRSTLTVTTRGVGLHEDGQKGHAGMMSTNCPFETEKGSVTGDYQLPGEGEEIQDVGWSWLGTETVVAVLEPHVFLLEKSLGYYRHEDVEVPGVQLARLYDTGLVALTSDTTGCALVWIEDGERLGTVQVPCGSDLTTDPASGLAVVASGGQVGILEPSGVTLTEVSGDLVAWDPATEATYVATAGDSLVTAMEPDGAIRWTAEVEGAVTALTDAGARGAALVVLEQPDGRGGVVYLDGWTGGERGWLDTPQPARQATVSGNGAVLALSADNGAHFYDIRGE